MSGEKLFWSNVAVAMASAAGIAAAVTVTGISKASPAVLTYDAGGPDPANGAYVLIECQGMVEVNARLFRVANVNAATNTFELEGEDTTGYKTFISGSFKVVTFDRSFTTLTEPSASGGEPIFEDVTTIHDVSDVQAVVSSTPQTYGFVSLYDPANAALIEANRAFKARSARPFLITFANGSKYAAYGTFAAALAPSSSGRKVTTPVSIALTNTGTAYAS